MRIRPKNIWERGNGVGSDDAGKSESDSGSLMLFISSRRFHLAMMRYADVWVMLSYIRAVGTDDLTVTGCTNVGYLNSATHSEVDSLGHPHSL